jgi:hypothetical protein
LSPLTHRVESKAWRKIRARKKTAQYLCEIRKQRFYGENSKFWEILTKTKYRILRMKKIFKKFAETKQGEINERNEHARTNNGGLEL